VTLITRSKPSIDSRCSHPSPRDEITLKMLSIIPKRFYCVIPCSAFSFLLVELKRQEPLEARSRENGGRASKLKSLALLQSLEMFDVSEDLEGCKRVPPLASFLTVWIRRTDAARCIQEHIFRRAPMPTRAASSTRGTPAALRPKSHHITQAIANDVFNFICIPKYCFLHSILQNSRQLEVTPAQVRRI
jgi:hypothetical protein